MLKTIIIALDASPASERLIQALQTLQILPETQVIFAHVIPAETGTMHDVERPHQSQESRYQAIEQQFHHYQTRLDRLEIENSVEIVGGDPAEEIVRLANIHQANLILVGTRGLKGVKRIIEDSVSSQVVTEAPCSVLVVKLSD